MSTLFFSRSSATVISTVDADATVMVVEEEEASSVIIVCVCVCVCLCVSFVVCLYVFCFKLRLSSDLIVSGTHEKFVKVTWYKCRWPSHAK